MAYTFLEGYVEPIAGALLNISVESRARSLLVEVLIVFWEGIAEACDEVFAKAFVKHMQEPFWQHV